MRDVLSKEQRSKLDPEDDRQFYAFPRLVKHVDDGFLASVTELYRCAAAWQCLHRQLAITRCVTHFCYLYVT
jgi:hypothetical protein